MPISTFNGLNIALRGLTAQQRSLDTTAHNIANASTEGYTRQEAVHAAASPLAQLSVFGQVIPGQIGQGVEISGYRRMRDAFTDNALRGQFGRQSGAEVRHGVLGAVEDAFPEPGEHGLQALMEGYWSAWHDIATNPESAGARTALVERARALCAGFTTASTDLAAQRTTADSQANALVNEVGTLSAQIDTLNDAISGLVAMGQEPNDLRDQRDLAIDRLAKIGNVTVSYSGNEVATVTVGGLAVVDPTGPIARTRADFATQFGSSALSAGKLHAFLDAYTNVIPAYQSRLDALAVSLHDAVNTQHATGFTLAGTAGGLFFASASITSAAQLAIDPALSANGSLVAAAGSAAGAPGDSSGALAIIALRANATPTGSTLGTTFDDYYQSLVSNLGALAQTAARDDEALAEVVRTLTDRRDEVSGVSLDEEMTNMVQFQHAYAAAGRIMSAIDEMLDVLMRTGRVGS